MKANLRYDLSLTTLNTALPTNPVVKQNNIENETIFFVLSVLSSAR
jgi:hypothetical protein